MWYGYVVPLLVGGALSMPRGRGHHDQLVVRQATYGVSSQYTNSTSTTTSIIASDMTTTATTATTQTNNTTTTAATSKTTTTTTRTITTRSTSTLTTTTTSKNPSGPGSGGQSPPYSTTSPSTSESTCRADSTLTFTGTALGVTITVTSTTDTTSESTVTDGSFNSLSTPYVTIETPLPPCYTVTSTSAGTMTRTTTKVFSTSRAYNTTKHASPSVIYGTLSVTSAASEYTGPPAPSSISATGVSTTVNGTSGAESTGSPIGSPVGAGTGTTTSAGTHNPPTTTAIGIVTYTSTQIVTRKTVIPVGPSSSQPALSFGGGSNNSGHGADGSNPGDSPAQDNSNGGDSGSPVTPPAQQASGTQVIGGETVTYGPTAVVIGGSTVIIPTSQAQNPPVISVNDHTFTIYPSQIVGPGTTFNLPYATAAVSMITQPPSTVVVDGVTVTVGPSQAVISGTTYHIGIPSDPQTIVVAGQSITLNSHGVVFPSTTLSPALTIGVSGTNLYEIVVLDGMTISIEGTDAIISGTTYKIGSGAGSASTMTIGGKTVTAGPGGLIVGGTTIDPTSIDHTATATATEGAGPSTSTPTPTGNGGTQSSTKKNMGISSQPQHHSILELLPTLICAAFFIIRI